VASIVPAEAGGGNGKVPDADDKPVEPAGASIVPAEVGGGNGKVPDADDKPVEAGDICDDKVPDTDNKAAFDKEPYIVGIGVESVVFKRLRSYSPTTGAHALVLF
jgi:hypothetical protein